MRSWDHASVLGVRVRKIRIATEIANAIIRGHASMKKIPLGKMPLPHPPENDKKSQPHKINTLRLCKRDDRTRSGRLVSLRCSYQHPPIMAYPFIWPLCPVPGAGRLKDLAWALN